MYLDRERRRLHAVFQALNEAVLLVDFRGMIAFYNPAAKRLLALPENTKPIPHLWHWIPTLKSFFTQSNSDALPDVLTTETELTYPEKRFVRLHLQPFSDIDTKPQFMVLLQDITQERMRSEEQLFQGCLDSVTQLASEIAHELGNPLNAIGIHLQLIQRALKALLSPTDIAACSESQSKEQTELSITSPEISLSVLKNTVATANPANLPACSAQTTGNGIALSAKFPRRKLKSSNTAIVPIVPTTAISVPNKQYSEPLPKTKPLHTLLQSLSVCQSEVQRLDTLVQQFLKSIRPQSVQLKRGNILSPLKKALSVLKPQLDNAHITVELDVTEPIPSVFMDADHLHQAFFNLLKNAREAIGTNGRICISCGQNEQYLILSFADSGCGMPETQAMRPFLKANTAQKPHGHGIGMLVVQRIMREHNGLIEIESKASVGSIVSLKFPLPEPVMHKITLRRPKASQKKKKTKQ